MFQVARVTDALPAVDPIVENSAPEFVLLPHRFDAVISDHADFAPGCESGFESYEEYSGFLLTSDDVRTFVLSEVCRRYNRAEVVWGLVSLPYRAGFCLGFLSAFACAHRDLASFGLDLLFSLVSYAYWDEVQRGCNPLVAVPSLRECR